MFRVSRLSLAGLCAASLAALTPVTASAQAMASAFSVTFGEGGSATIDGGRVSASQITSMSMGTAQGSYAVAGASAGGGVSTAVAGASMEGSLPPVLRMRASGMGGANPYETELFFGDASAKPSYEQDLLAPSR